MGHRINELISPEALCITAPTTPGQLKSITVQKTVGKLNRQTQKIATKNAYTSISSIRLCPLSFVML